ncbi:hypothetical protein TNCV_4743691 [Trichonephila clavipes]|nr:hypothetical protein TNCV_4743691 [Trichonephila clavipes]
MVSLGRQSLLPTDLDRVDETMASRGGGYYKVFSCLAVVGYLKEPKSQIRIWSRILPTTVLTSQERSISALKSVKTEMRSTMEKEMLNSLMLLCAQNITMDVVYNDVMNDFAMTKTRRKPLFCTSAILNKE